MRNKKFKIITGVLLILLICFTFSITSVNASPWSGISAEETVIFLQKYRDYLSYGNILLSVLHWLGWGIVKILFAMCSSLEKLIPESLSLLNFLDDAGMQGIIKAVINDLVVVLMVLVLVYLGFKTIIAKNPPNFKSIGVNIFISAFLILGMPTLMNTMQDISLEFYDATQTGMNNEQVSSLAWGLIQDNTIDLLYVANQGFSILNNSSSIKNTLTPETFKSANLDSLITPKTIPDIGGTEIKNLEYRLDINENGNIIADKIESSVFGFLSEGDGGYFRYSVKFTPIIVGLGALLVSYAFTVFVFITTVIEIGFKRVVGLFVFATDLESGQRTKMVIQDIGNAFLLIAFTGLSLKMYTLFLSFLATSNVNPIIYIIAIVSATFVLIKGSNTIMRYFGVDVGLKEGFGQMAGAFALGRGASSMARGLKNLGEKSTSKNNMENLSGQESNTLNNLNSDSGLKKSVNSAGKSFGYARNRGFGGMAEDAVKGMGDKMTGGIKNSVNSIKDQWNDGISQGEAKGQANQEKWDGRKSKNQSINDSDSIAEMKAFDSGIVGQASHKENPSLENKTSINDQESLQKTKEGCFIQENDSQGQMNTNLNKMGNSLQNQSRPQSTEDVLRKMRLEDAIKPGSMDTTGNIKMKSDMENGREVRRSVSASDGISEVAATMQMDVLGNMKMNPSKKNDSIDQKINTIQGESLVHNVTHGTAQPSIQKVVQDIEGATISNPEKVRQSIKQDVKSNGSFQPQEIRTRVVQETEKASIDNSSLKQNVTQDIEKTFKAKPKSSGYFGALLPDDLKVEPVVRKGERFKKLK